MPGTSGDSLLRRETHSLLASMLADIAVLIINCERLKKAPGFDCEEFKARLESAREIVQVASEASRTRKAWNSRANPTGQ